MPSSTALVLSARGGQCGQGTTSIGRVLYVERLTAGSTAAARKCLLITRKIMIPPPDSRDPPDRPPYFAKKRFPPDCWDPPTTSSHARKCLVILPDSRDPPGRSVRSVVILVANVYVHTIGLSAGCSDEPW